MSKKKLKKEIKKLKKEIKRLYSINDEYDHIIAGDELRLEELDKSMRLQIRTMIKLLNSHSDKINKLMKDDFDIFEGLSDGEKLMYEAYEKERKWYL